MLDERAYIEVGRVKVAHENMDCDDNRAPKPTYFRQEVDETIDDSLVDGLESVQ